MPYPTAGSYESLRTVRTYEVRLSYRVKGEDTPLEPRPFLVRGEEGDMANFLQHVEQLGLAGNLEVMVIPVHTISVYALWTRMQTTLLDLKANDLIPTRPGGSGPGLEIWQAEQLGDTTED